ncbi:hypothetical protein AMIS_25880 [Actinoplanes missouriensis 431]|uniref:Uncharacterized protein n=1 Tax=Actinoplanes missouriensis (strain ATCC 14538 / DSM 43046 / CBS 188.64 / JCM 3121 / NBRC 102363 / NCIMB 12654 / NRRL B-3342 / UNCC 431) TaxID=512565 RepID=I0H471_ACTM4|nr:hypothetical protein [Actinoplanes missouriensis]BAL87808.1 hypothetical protein AMIS_25880 [Actinoplanes missouriensis 431]
MNRWKQHLWQALVALGEAAYPIDRATVAYEWEHRRFRTDLDDGRSVRAAFRSMIEREFGAQALKDDR